MRRYMCVIGLVVAGAGMPVWGQEGARDQQLQQNLRMLAAAAQAYAAEPAAIPPILQPVTAPASAPATDTKAAAEFAPFPGGIVDGQWKTAYLAAAGGGLDAVDLKTGKRIWSSVSSARPLAIEGDRVYALVPTEASDEDHPAFHVMALSIKGQGKIVFQSKPITVADWIAGSATGKTLTAAGKIENGALTLSWSAINGAAPAPGVRVIRRRGGVVIPTNDAGSAKVDLKEGTVKTLDGNPAVPLTPLTEVKHDGIAYKTETDPDSQKTKVICTDAKSLKTVWECDIDTPVGNVTGTPPGLGGGGLMPVPAPMPIRPLLRGAAEF